MNSQDDPKAKPRFEHFGRKLDAEFGGAAEKLEREKEKVITYLNNEVVPAIRTIRPKRIAPGCGATLQTGRVHGQKPLQIAALFFLLSILAGCARTMSLLR